MTHVLAGFLGPRPSAGVSLLVAPVALAGFDEIAREDLAGGEIDDRDFPFVNNGQDTAAGVGRATTCAGACAARV